MKELKAGEKGIHVFNLSFSVVPIMDSPILTFLQNKPNLSSAKPTLPSLLTFFAIPHLT